MTIILWLYFGYYFVLLGVLIAQLSTDQGNNYTNWGTVAVTTSHFTIGFVESIVAGSVFGKARERYAKWYNVAADVLTLSALVLSIVALSEYSHKQPQWAAYVPISLAAVGNTGCMYGRLHSNDKQPTALFVFL